MKAEPQGREFKRFDAAMDKLLALPREEYQRRLTAYKETPKKRGRPPKVKPDASPDSGGKPQV